MKHFEYYDMESAAFRTFTRREYSTKKINTQQSHYLMALKPNLHTADQLISLRIKDAAFTIHQRIIHRNS